MSDERILLEPTGAEALVLFEFLTRWDRSGKLAFEDTAERWASNYRDLPQRAGERVRDGREW